MKIMNRRQLRAFTVIELLVVLAAIGLLLSVAAPRYVQHLDMAREVALKEDLYQMRDAIDKFYSDQGRYPVELSELVAKRYLRTLPLDPITQRLDSWIAVPPPSTAGISIVGRIMDIRSGAVGKAIDGSLYVSW